jgi:hypothetical protein
MPFPSVTTVLDDFAGTGALSGSWTVPVDSGDSTPTRVSDVWSGIGSFCSSYWSATSFAADQEVSIDATAANTHRLFLRISGGSWYRLEIDYSYSPDQAQIRYWNGSIYTTVATSSGDIGTSQAFGFEAIGTTLTGYKKVGGVWSSIVSGTDSNLTGSGNIGVGAYSSTLDNFVGGAIVNSQPWHVRQQYYAGARRGFGGQHGVR